ncbi:MAG: hypothetical protein JWM53_3414 [bacterium]|nr:hypothetical protein [bacterium]
MKRAISILIAIGGLATSGCDPASCGPGTKRVQNRDGGVQCVAADGAPASIHCDADAGAVVVGGQCVSRISCGPNTTFDATSGQCVGTGGVTSGCTTPDAQHVCVYGTIHDFLDDTPATGRIHVAVYNPLSLLSDPTTPPLTSGAADFDGGQFTFPNLSFAEIGQLGLIAVVVGDPTRATSILCATGDTGISGGHVYRMDGYLLQPATVAGWKSTGGFDALAAGAYVAKFYADPKPANTDVAVFETMKVAGVQLSKDGAVATDARYFASDLSTLGSGTSTNALTGAAIVPAPGGGQTGNYSGVGGGIPVWETQPGGSLAGVVFVARFHANP